MDLNQVMIANMMVSLGNHVSNTSLEESLLRHMILNTIRLNRNKFNVDVWGELILACDDRNYWRREIFPYYKAGRKKSRDASGLDWGAIFTILNKIRDEIKEVFPYRTIQIDTAEADDVIGTLCHAFGKQLGGDPILILSGDKDFIQLQTYSNVSQYDPVQKKWIKHNDPDSFALEHIMRGDSGDGVPNFLSSDDSIVTPNVRQKPVTTKKVTDVLNKLKSGESPQQVFSSGEYRNWMRNKKLIDLKEIPENIKEKVMIEYDNQANKSRDKLFNYFITNRLKNLTENISEF
jgi:hypothetical protein